MMTYEDFCSLAPHKIQKQYTGLLITNRT